MSYRVRGYIAIVFVTLVWAVNYLFVKYLSLFFDGETQNGWRYAASALFLVGLSMWRGRWPVRCWRDARQILLPVVPNLMFQIAWTHSLYFLYPGMSALLAQAIIVFSAIVAYLLLPDERPVIRSPRYLAGVVLLIAGSTGIVLANAQLDRPVLLAGVVLSLISCFGWALYSVAIRHVVARIDPISAFTGVNVISAVVLLGFAAGTADVTAPVRAGWLPNLVLIASGMVSVGVAHTLYFYSIRILGVAICSVIILSSPVVTLGLSAFFFGESMTPVQLASGALLLVGALVATLAGSVREPECEVAAAHQTGRVTGKADACLAG